MNSTKTVTIITLLTLIKHYEICDKNSNGKLTLIEASSQKCRIPSEIFTQADSNLDNLTLEEIKKNSEELENKTFHLILLNFYPQYL
jgi:hypothetical protein